MSSLNPKAEAERLPLGQRLPPYVFDRLAPSVEARHARGDDVYNFAMGNPDLRPPEHVIDALNAAASVTENHRYSTGAGVPVLREAIARYYTRRFGVELDPDTEICATLGAKEGIATSARALFDFGDVVLAPDPSYPIHRAGFDIAGAHVEPLAFAAPGDILERVENYCRTASTPPAALILNFPNNPTGMTVELDFYVAAVELAKRFGFILFSDLAYADLSFEGSPPPSVLQIPEARGIALEFSSLSKTYSMPGWRVGFAAGAPILVSALKRLKSYLDYGSFTPVQLAAAAALDGPQDYVQQTLATYRRRRDVLVSEFTKAGFHIPSPAAGMFCWAEIPAQFCDAGSLAFAKRLLEETGILVAPGIGFGKNGDAYVRLALTETEDRIIEAAEQLASFLAKT